MKRMSVRLGWALLIGSLILTVCTVEPHSPELEEGSKTENFEEVSELFIEGDTPEETIFLTNDRAYWSPLGYTLWCLRDEITDPFVARGVTCSKISGDDIAGYGIIFCHQKEPELESGESMLTVMLNTLGEYIVGEIIDDDFFQICPWTSSPYLSQGYNQTNRVEVLFSGSEYDLYLNGHHVYSFTDEDEPLHTGGDNGYIVVISPQDRFPEETVQVRFVE